HKGGCPAFELRTPFVEACSSLLEAFHVPFGYNRPDHPPSQFPCSFTRCSHENRIGEKAIHTLSNCTGIGEWNKNATILCKQLLRVPIGRGDDCFTGAERISQRTGSNLRFVEIGRDIDVGGADEFLQFL